MAQNSLASPPAATSSSTSSSNNNNNNNASPQKQRLALLRLKRADLEKRLQEKNNLLQELSRKEAHLIGVYPTAGLESHPSSSADDIGGLLNAKGSGHNTHSLPRKIGTGFTLSEKYLNKRTLSSPLNAPASQRDEEELNNLLLQRDIQQQICKASLKLLNDAALTKSVRRKHKQSYEVAQQKLQEIGQGLHQQQKRTINNQQEPPPLGQQQQPQQRRNRHDSYSSTQQHHSPVTYHASDQSKGLYRSTSNSSSLNNASVLGKSSLSLDKVATAMHQHHHLQQQQQHQQQPHQQKPLSYESKSLHNFVMSSPATTTTSFQSSPHHHPALMSPTFYQPSSSSSGGGGFAMTASRAQQQHHHPSNPGSLRQSHQQHQFMSPPPQQVVIPQSGLGGYWTLNEHNERVWCASHTFSPDASGSTVGHYQPPPRHATTLDRKAAIYMPNTSASHGKLKMPSPEASPSSHHNHHNHPTTYNQLPQQHHGNGGHPGKSFSIPHKSTSMGHIEYLSQTGSRGGEDTASLGSFNSDTNNNPAVYQHLTSALANTKLSHYPNHHLPGDTATSDHHQLLEDDTNNNQHYHHLQMLSADPVPPPLRPKSSASQHAPEKSWYETSLDASKSVSARHKPPALLPRELTAAAQLHIEIPTSPIGSSQQLERSMSHRVVVGGGSLHLQPPPITRQHNLQHPEDKSPLSPSGGGGVGGVGMPMSPHKKLLSGTATASNNVSNNNNNNNNNSGNAVRRSQSNVLLTAGQQHQLSTGTNSAQLLSPRLVNGHQTTTTSTTATLANTPTTPLSPVALGAAAAEGEEIQVESPKNMTVVQQGKFQPYKEETKPFEMSDFYKYSTKFRQQGSAGGGGGTVSGNRGSSRNADENLFRGNVLYQQEQQQQSRNYTDLADVTNNNNNNNSNNRGSSNNHQPPHHNNSNGHMPLLPKSNSNNSHSMYDRAAASNAHTTAASGGGGVGQYQISYQQ